MSLCNRKGCVTPTTGARQYCDAHLAEDRRCIVQGCDSRIGVANRSGHCHEHRVLARQRREWLDQ